MPNLSYICWCQLAFLCRFNCVSRWFYMLNQVFIPANCKCSKWWEVVLCFGDSIEEEDICFKKIKNLVSDAMLVLPKDTDKLCLRTDASNSTISAVLETSDRKPVYFCSRVLNDAEKRYDIVEKEALAIFWGIKRLRSFLLGREFTVFSDHKPLQFIFNSNNTSAKVLRWKMQLQEFNFKVIYCSRKDNTESDCITRINIVEPLVGEGLISENEVILAQKFDKEC